MHHAIRAWQVLKTNGTPSTYDKVLGANILSQCNEHVPIVFAFGFPWKNFVKEASLFRCNLRKSRDQLILRRNIAIKMIHATSHVNPCDCIKCYFDEHKTLEQIEASSHNHNNQKTTSFWCSALISFVLVVAGFLDKSVPWTVITPYDFSAFCKPQRLVFQGCAYEPEAKLC
jgi:hypothetical protein